MGVLDWYPVGFLQGRDGGAASADMKSSDYVTKNIDYLKTQVGNPEGPNKPNKKKYDPRVWVREGEKTMSTRVTECLNDFKTAGTL